MSPLPPPTSAPAPSPSLHNSLLATRSTSSQDPLIPLYVILGVVGGVIVLLILALTSLLGGWCCCRQALKALKAYQCGPSQRQHNTSDTYDQRHSHGQSDRPSSASSVHRSQKRKSGPRANGYTQATLLKPYPDRSSPRRASCEGQIPRPLLPAPPASYDNFLQPPKSYSPPTHMRQDHNYSSPPLLRSVSRPEYPASLARPSDIFTTRPRLEYDSSRQGGYGYYTLTPPRPGHDSQSRRPSRESSERSASTFQPFPSLSSNGRPSLASDW